MIVKIAVLTFHILHNTGDTEAATMRGTCAHGAGCCISKVDMQIGAECTKESPKEQKTARGHQLSQRDGTLPKARS